MTITEQTHELGKLIKESEKLLEIGEGKVMKVLEKNGKLKTEDLE